MIGSLTTGAWDATRNMAEAMTSPFRDPVIRLGVTGLSRAGKTVFITSLVANLMDRGRMPQLRAAAEGRVQAAWLQPQPDDDVARFAFEEHLAALTSPQPHWPEGTRRVSELRLSFRLAPTGLLGGLSGPRTLHLDIVDYPGEWLLDLALLDADYGDWSRQTVEASRKRDRAAIAAGWHEFLKTIDPAGPADEVLAAKASDAFKTYLQALRAGEESVATTPPGRFLMPGDLAGSPALTFAPLDLPMGQPVASGSFAALMERRFEAYKTYVVRPFFRDHFQRIDRQIVLVDVLAAIDAGPVALAELEEALDQVLMAFRTGRNTFLSRLFSPRADRVLFAATKADHIHHTDHDRLDAILRLLVNRAARRTEAAGARVGTVALASVRATRETTVREGRETLRAVAGVPEAGEQVGDEIFDGLTEAAIFPGELPGKADAVFHGAVPPGSLRFPRFRPPQLAVDAAGRMSKLPHIRLDRALEFLLGDRLA